MTLIGIYERIFINKQFGIPEMLALFIALSVIMISIVIFFENKKPEKTIAWLLADAKLNMYQ